MNLAGRRVLVRTVLSVLPTFAAEEGTEGKRQGSATLPVGAGRSADGWKVQSGVELGVLTSREGRAGDT